MKFAVIAARILLALPFLLLGVNGIFPFMPMPAMPGDQGIFLTLLLTHKYTAFIALLELVAAILLLVGRYVPIALVLLGPILVNILLFHFLIAGAGAAPGVVLSIIEIFLIYAYRASFLPLFQADPKVS